MIIRKKSKLLGLGFVFIISGVILYTVMNLHSNDPYINSSSLRRDTSPIHQTSIPQTLESGAAKNFKSSSITNHQSLSTFDTKTSSQTTENALNAKPDRQSNNKVTPNKKTAIGSNTTSSPNASLTNSNANSDPTMWESVSNTTAYHLTSSTNSKAKPNSMTPEFNQTATPDQQKSESSSNKTVDSTPVSNFRTTSDQQKLDNGTTQPSQSESLTTPKLHPNTTKQQTATTIAATTEDITNKNDTFQNNIGHENPSGQDDKKTNLISIFVGLVVGISLIVALAYICFRVRKRKQTMRGSTYLPLINHEDDTDQIDML